MLLRQIFMPSVLKWRINVFYVNSLINVYYNVCALFYNIYMLP